MDEFEELMEEHDNDQEGDQNDDSALTIDDHDGKYKIEIIHPFKAF